ncbi:pyrroloquinoline quinone-dependent dehydrogenase [Salipiger mangrovisoli]|uniref:Pyrroloquinoline quinone-dependent dehydrogenase n=1 Tax=Salipiger mangrovisoli TaxID=2865933 RepID=A0ABR9X2Z1_9RHOB|nr:pyrroloquinoline quinone-dependent dehydrogenase [Salipiger mangrovisoli]MBE9637863.1 pyrroloquinoline quinone-dependent dehydrogenase [Salipiger mangrovisoli]
MFASLRLTGLPGAVLAALIGLAACPGLAQDTASVAAAAPASEVGTDWPYYGGDAEARRFSPLAQITPENVARLERAFVYHTGDLPPGDTAGNYAPETTPLKIGSSLVLCSAMNILISINAATGAENWRYDPEVPQAAIPYGATCRGVATYTAPDLAADAPCKRRVIGTTLDARLIAVDFATGRPCEGFGSGGQVDLWDGIGEKIPGFYALTAAPTVVRGIIVTGAQVKDGQAEDAPSGVVRGFDAVTGALVWAWDLAAPEEMRAGPPAGKTYTRGTPNMWTTATADEARGIVFLPLGNSAVDYYGSNRSQAENTYATSLVALNAVTGEELWHFQTVRHDLWDYDLGSQPTLLDFKGRPAVLLASKQGDLFILDRETGAPLTEVGEITDLPQGKIEPDFVADSQPVSLWATLRKPALTEKRMWGFTPIDQLYCRIRFRQAVYDGYLTPPSTRNYIQYPGYIGGSDWGSVAVDVARGLVIANYNDIPNLNRLVSRAEADAAGMRPPTAQAGDRGQPQVGAPYGARTNAGWRSGLTDLPCSQPPYGGITAIDLQTGEPIWDRPLGSARRGGPFGLPSMLPFEIGTPNNGGAVVTASGLIFIGAAADNLFRAIDIESGETLWTDALPAGGQANPISYEVDGRQYVLISAGGHHALETGVSDAIIAYRLPD